VLVAPWSSRLSASTSTNATNVSVARSPVAVMPPILLAVTATGLILVARLPGGRGR
jgi:hypothetical protein